MPTAPCTIPEMSRNCPFPPSPRLTSPPNQSSASGGFSWWRLHAIVAAIATIIPATAMVLAHAEQRELNAPGASAPATEIELPGGFRIKDKFINFDQERIQLTIAYRRLHQDPNASDVIIEPKMIILHWTAIPSFNSTWNYFNRNRAEAAREQLAACRRGQRLGAISGGPRRHYLQTDARELDGPPLHWVESCCHRS